MFNPAKHINITEEMRRIRAAGGFVEFNRVNGTLALSRALGDFEFKCATRLPKDQMVTGGSGFYFFLNISMFRFHGMELHLENS